MNLEANNTHSTNFCSWSFYKENSAKIQWQIQSSSTDEVNKTSREMVTLLQETNCENQASLTLF